MVPNAPLELHVFGSVARGRAQQASDLDLLVDFPASPSFEQFMDLKLALEDLLNVRVDLVTRNGLRAELRERIEREWTLFLKDMSNYCAIWNVSVKPPNRFRPTFDFATPQSRGGASPGSVMFSPMPTSALRMKRFGKPSAPVFRHWLSSSRKLQRLSSLTLFEAAGLESAGALLDQIGRRCAQTLERLASVRRLY